MRYAVLLASLLTAAGLAGCAGDLSASNFTLTANAVGWKTGDLANFTLTFDASGSDVSQYEIDTTFAISQVRFEKEGLNVAGDYETDRASDVDIRFEGLDGGQHDSYLLTSSKNQVYLRVRVPDTLDNGEYVLEMELFKVGIVESDVFRVAKP